MSTLSLFNSGGDTVPGGVAWHLADLGEHRGRQELYTRQSPQRLKVLREHAVIESAVSSNRIEGVCLDPKRVHDVMLAKRPVYRDRDEEEIRGYRDALNFVHSRASSLSVTGDVICRLHAMIRGDVWDAGCYKSGESDIIERYPDGRSRVRFQTVPAADTPRFLAELLSDLDVCLTGRTVHPLVAAAAFNLDFLCIHPFRDGNGRVSRLLLLLQFLHLGYEAVRYVSFERIIEENKARYYEVLEQSSAGWHENSHDPWPYVGFVLFMLKTAHKEFEERVGKVQAPRGAKTQMIVSRLAALPEEFSLAQLEQACPGVSREMVRRVLAGQKGKTVECVGRGPGAKWVKKG